MEDLSWLEKIAANHEEWVKIVNSFGEYDYAEDLVQEMYIVLSKYASESKIIKDGKISKGYIYFTLRTCFLQYINAKRKIYKVDIEDPKIQKQIQHDDEMDEKIGFDVISRKIDNHLNNWRWYDKTLFRLYRDSDMSIRKIAKETGISWISIFNTLKKCKGEIFDTFGEDYEDYKNGDYDRI
jgi:RNA polymerase sigma factor (sigma-70 family)|tara:strand:+ start:3997 stop:4542 length:546 start_codon:yes stop_codon:yes gene_type:complete